MFGDIFHRKAIEIHRTPLEIPYRIDGPTPPWGLEGRRRRPAQLSPPKPMEGGGPLEARRWGLLERVPLEVGFLDPLETWRWCSMERAPLERRVPWRGASLGEGPLDDFWGHVGTHLESIRGDFGDRFGITLGVS